MSESKGRIPQEIIDEVLSRVDIVDVIGRYVPLKRQGQNYTGLCPFHNEKTPSFSVSPGKQIFHCFGCGMGGNVFKFLMEIEHLTFPEAVRQLASEVGVKVPEREQSETEKRFSEKRNRLLKWNEFAAYYYQAVLHAEIRGDVYNAYLDKRGIEAQVRQKFSLGGCLEGWDGLYKYLKKKGASDADLLELGLVAERDSAKGCYDRFRDRLMFPIRDASGHVIAFGGRIIDAEKAPQKYMNSPDSPIFHKGKMVYGLDLAKASIRAKDQVLIVEGYMDVIACHQAGITNVVAPLGTALTEDQVKLLMRYTYNFVTAFDGDGAGVRATLKSISLIEGAGAKVRILAIPEGKDPDEYIKAYGTEAFALLLQGAKGGYTFRLQEAIKEHPGDALENKLEILDAMLPFLASLRHSAQLELAVRETADVLYLSEQSIKTELQNYKRHGQRRQGYRDMDSVPSRETPVAKKMVLSKNEATLLTGLSVVPDFIIEIENTGGRALFEQDGKVIYDAFKTQFNQGKGIDGSKLGVEESALFAAASMQEADGIFEGRSKETCRTILENALRDLKYSYINKAYQSLLSKIGQLEKGGQFDEMEQALIELEAIRQKKTQFEEVMRGDKQ